MTIQLALAALLTFQTPSTPPSEATTEGAAERRAFAVDVTSAVRDRVNAVLPKDRGVSYDIGVLSDGRVALYTDHANYLDPGRPLVVGPQDLAKLPSQPFASWNEAKAFFSSHLSPLEAAPDLWAKARLLGVALEIPIGAVTIDGEANLFVYFPEAEAAAILGTQDIAILDLLIRQGASGARLALKDLHLDGRDIKIAAFRARALSTTKIASQYDVLFGFDPFVLTFVSASRALHNKDLVKDGRNKYDRQSDEFMGRPYTNTLVRFVSTAAPGVVNASWPAKVDASALARIEETARGILGKMRETEDLFLAAFGGFEVKDHSLPIPTESRAFWTFFEGKDWAWWKTPKLDVSNPERSETARLLFGTPKPGATEGKGSATPGMGGAWAEYFAKLNAGFKEAMTLTLEEISTEQLILEHMQREPSWHPDTPEPAAWARDLAQLRVAVEHFSPGFGGPDWLERLAQCGTFEGGPSKLFPDRSGAARVMQIDVSGCEKNEYAVRYGVKASTGTVFTPWLTTKRILPPDVSVERRDDPTFYLHLSTEVCSLNLYPVERGGEAVMYGIADPVGKDLSDPKNRQIVVFHQVPGGEQLGNGR